MTVPLPSHLFTPVRVGPITLKHRVVMAPLTRSRSEQPGDIPGDLMLEYYAQRPSDGGFIVSEGTSVSLIEDYRKAAERAKASGFDGVELHAANGYLPDQFLQDRSNKRTDAHQGQCGHWRGAGPCRI
jgi:2,4-dienoyl-CoA reductase-like NADH-dependent reductase (Old Yellow Enzyme family)